MIDCFLFNDELELLSLRLAVLGASVERFVLVEATRTFTGHPKPLTYAAHKAQFGSWQDRITHIIVADTPTTTTDPWEREAWQRNQIARGLGGLGNGVPLLIGDVDELPNPAALPAAGCELGFSVLLQTLYYYDAYTSRAEPWQGTCICTASDVRRYGAEGVRRRRDQVPEIARGGWHFSYTGGPDAIRAKLNAFSHQELNTPDAHANAEMRMSDGLDLFGRADVSFCRSGRMDDVPPLLKSEPWRWPGLTRWPQ